MTRTRTVRLEILRHGPSHNQLLSPLTQYLALCGNHGSVTVRVPYEHAQFLARHNALSYKTHQRGGDDDADRTQRELHLQITAQEMSNLLAGIPGLISELRETGIDDAFIHFELVLSASELALLPFELSNAPNGFPGSGQPLVLQSQSPLCLTRRVNRVDNDRFRWPGGFRILFVESLPDHDAELLVPSHLLALRQAIDPWVGRSQSDADGKAVPYWVSKYLTVLRRASVEAVFRELRRKQYTHVHILAHGVDYQEGVDKRFALQMRKDLDATQFDNVSGTRLSSLMRSFREGHGAKLSQPAVVTIASCNGAGQGSVVGAGSSIAHGLHEAQIPLVVSSQFPLSFHGSVLMVRSLYGGLLRGDDPRYLLADLRRRLKTQVPNTHDWAGIVAYAVLPANISGRLRQVRYEQSLRSIEAAFSYSDHISERWYQEQDSRQPAGQTKQAQAPESASTVGRELTDRLKDAKGRLHKLKNEWQEEGGAAKSVTQVSMISGRLGSTEKRQSEIEFQDGKSRSEPIGDTWLQTLKRAQKHYRNAFDTDRSQTWALVQVLVLETVCRDWSRSRERPQFIYWRGDRIFRRECRAARVLTRRDNRLSGLDESAWTIGNWIELELLSLRCVKRKKDIKKVYRRALRRAERNIERLVDIVGEDHWQLFSTRRQLNRYINWFYDGIERIEKPSDNAKLEDIPGLISGICKHLLNQLNAVSL